MTPAKPKKTKKEKARPWAKIGVERSFPEVKVRADWQQAQMDNQADLWGNVIADAIEAFEDLMRERCALSRALDVRCPECHAKPERWCTTHLGDTGVSFDACHPERYAAAIRDRSLLEDDDA